MQKLTILGNMGKDLEERHTQNGVKVISFSVAVNVKKDTTVWYEVTIWQQKIPLFERMLPHMKKGTRLIIGGNLMPVETYMDKRGETRIKLRIEPDYLQFSGGGKEDRKDDIPSVFEVPQGKGSHLEVPFEEDPELPF